MAPAVSEQDSKPNNSVSASAALRSESSTSAPVSSRFVRSRRTFASASRCWAVRRKVDSRCTVQPTSAAEAANTKSATTSSVRWILNDPVGSVKNQLRAKNPTIAAASPAVKPSVPTARTVTSRSSAAVVRSACAARASPAAAPTAITASATRITDRSRRRIPADTIARIPRAGSHPAARGREPPLASADADVRNAFDPGSGRMGDGAQEARAHPGGHRRRRGAGPEGARAVRARWASTTS